MKTLKRLRVGWLAGLFALTLLLTACPDTVDDAVEPGVIEEEAPVTEPEVIEEEAPIVEPEAEEELP